MNPFSRSDSTYFLFFFLFVFSLYSVLVNGLLMLVEVNLSISSFEPCSFLFYIRNLLSKS